MLEREVDHKAQSLREAHKSQEDLNGQLAKLNQTLAQNIVENNKLQVRLVETERTHSAQYAYI